MNELKKCPFCGGDAKVYRNLPCTAYGVWCINEGCSANARHLNFDSENEAIEAWNTRTPAEEVIARLEEAKGKIFGENGEVLTQEDYFIDIDDAIKIIKEGLE